MDHAAVAVAVGHEHFAVGRDRHVGRPVEVSFVAAGLAGRAERLQELALRGALEDDVLPRIGQPDHPLAVDLDAVAAHARGCYADQVAAPRPDELALGRIDLHRRVGPGEYPNLVLSVDGDAGRAGPRHVLRPLGPIGIDLVPGRQRHARIRRRLPLDGGARSGRLRLGRLGGPEQGPVEVECPRQPDGDQAQCDQAPAGSQIRTHRLLSFPFVAVVWM